MYIANERTDTGQLSTCTIIVNYNVSRNQQVSRNIWNKTTVLQSISASGIRLTCQPATCMIGQSEGLWSNTNLMQPGRAGSSGVISLKKKHSCAAETGIHTLIILDCASKSKRHDTVDISYCCCCWCTCICVEEVTEYLSLRLRFLYYVYVLGQSVQKEA